MAVVKVGLKRFVVQRTADLKPREVVADAYEKIEDKTGLGFPFSLILFREGNLKAEYTSVQWFEIHDPPTGESFKIGSGRSGR